MIKTVVRMWLAIIGVLGMQLVLAQDSGLARPMPKFAGISHWLNVSKPLEKRDLLGQVILVEFWTSGCVNCVHTLLHIQEWHERYHGRGLQVIGVHSPEFWYERSLETVTDSVKKHGLTYPIAIDNSYRTWEAYQNRYWSALYLIDRNGSIRSSFFGEGNYEQVEENIRRLLAERNAEAPGREPKSARKNQGGETR